MAKKYKIASNEIVPIVKPRLAAAKANNIKIIVNRIKTTNEKRREERYFFMRRELSDESFCSNREGIESWG
jgi:hypothetical protein